MKDTKHSKAVPIVLVVLGILLLLFGAWMSSWYDRFFKPPSWQYVVNFLPGIVLASTAFFANRIKRWRVVFIIACVVFFLVAIVLIGLINCGLAFGLSVKPETNPADYQDALKYLGYPERPYLQHFPVPTPKNATDVSFHWTKHFLQGSMDFQLRFTLPPAEIESLLEQSMKRKAKNPEGREPTSRVEPPWYGLWAGETEPASEWPEDFQIIVFRYGHAGHYRDPTYPTGQSYGYGVAISQQRNEIVYWVEEY